MVERNPSRERMGGIDSRWVTDLEPFKQYRNLRLEPERLPGVQVGV